MIFIERVPIYIAVALDSGENRLITSLTGRQIANVESSIVLVETKGGRNECLSRRGWGKDTPSLPPTNSTENNDPHLLTRSRRRIYTAPFKSFDANAHGMGQIDRSMRANWH